jgi:peptidoglycan biosynthesis protein MviN/MurJ (putative lipid II flippase)
MTQPAPAAPAAQRLLDGAFLRGMGMSTFYVAIVSALRLAQDAAIAWRFGTGPWVDAYYFLAALANWPIAVALSFLTILVAPIDARLRRADPLAREAFRGELLATLLLVAAVSLPLALWALRAIAGSPAGGLDVGTAAVATAGAPGLSAMVPLGVLSALLAAWLVAAGRHIVTLLEGLPALLLMAVVLLLPAPLLFWGATVGFALQALAMGWVLRRARELPAPRIGWHSPFWRSFSDGALILLATQVLFAVLPMVDALFAARLGDGAMAAVSYTSRMVLGLQGLAGLGLQRTGLPLLAAIGMHSPAEARRVALRWAMAVGAVGVIGGALAAVGADWIVSVLFERGNFTAADREQCASLLRYAMLQMPPYLAAMTLVTALSATSARRAIALITFINIVAKLVASFLLVPLLGAAGLMLATAVMYGVCFLVAWVALRHCVAGAVA